MNILDVFVVENIGTLLSYVSVLLRLHLFLVNLIQNLIFALFKGLLLALLRQLGVLLVNRVDVCEDLVLSLVQLRVLRVLDVLPLMTLNVHLLVDGDLLHFINGVLRLLLHLILLLVVASNTLVTPLNNLLAGQALHFEILPLLARDFLHEEDVQDSIDQLGLIAGMHVVNLMGEIDSFELLGGLSVHIDLKQEVGVEDTDILHKDVGDRDVDHDVLVSLGPLHLGGALLVSHFRYG
mmetsp:Transcript_36900/g.56495  ORF Transcript_36900/g.56495 Transcript_36900/m.56495 type:complete len:237 (-) Transcript_36900:11-721(-)